MANNHSSVVYVEPNDIYSFSDKISTDGRNHSKTPPLEDYCIAMNIEVEVASRENNVSVQGDKEVIVLAWRNESNKSTVNFMSGKRYSNGKRYLSTDWADMYTSDLIDHGTTEMLGIKSVNVEYNKTCIPVITVQFTDVRGMSLFQPKGLSRDNYAKSINGGKDIAQTFFECFFKIPYPIFTIYLKGYYGEPVAYEVMCDKFDTNFNAENGSFDVTVRFIGYWFSFLTDISYLVLLSSPYSDYRGQEYWESQVRDGRFVIPNREGTENVPMPKMFEIWAEWRKLIASSNEDLLDDVSNAELETHEVEISKLNEIRKMCQSWYKSLETVVQNKYGKERCIVLKNGDDYDGILVLVPVDSSSDMQDEYSQFPSEFLRLNDNLCATIDDYNSKYKAFSRVDNVSFDFSDYKKKKVLNYVYVDKWNGDKLTFGGVNGECPIPRDKVAEVVNNYNSLKVIYNDGVQEYVDGYFIDFNYTCFGNRINKLIQDSENNEENKKKARIKEQNRIMFSKMNWFPSVENFTKIVMAHLETMMAMMWDTAQNTKGRTLETLKISAENVDDVPSDAKTIPPFPRVTKSIIGDDGIAKTEDTWIGEFNKGEGFFEINIVNGLLNAVDLIKKLQEENNVEVEAIIEANRRTNASKGITMKYPLTSYDFYLTENPYGNKEDIKNNIAAFIGKVCMRMFGIFSLNGLIGEHPNEMLNSSTITAIAKLEAENFLSYIGDLDQNVKDALGANGCINASNALTIARGNITEAKKLGIIGDDGLYPWDNGSESTSGTPLFVDDGSGLWLSRFATSDANGENARYIYPIQRLSYDRIDREVRILKDGKEDFKDGSFVVSKIGESGSWKEDFLHGNYRSAYNDYYIDEEYTFVKDVVERASSEAIEEYKSLATLMGFGDNDTKPSGDYVSLLKNVNLEDRREIVKTAARITNKEEFYKHGWTIDNYFDIYKINHLDANDEVLISEIESNTFNDTCFLRTYGLYKETDGNGNEIEGSSYLVDDSHDFFSSLELGYYSVPRFNDGAYSDLMNGKYLETAAFLFSLNKEGASFKLLGDIESTKKAFARVPKLTLLQCGGVLALHYGRFGDFTHPINGVDDYHGVPFTSTYLNCKDNNIISFLNGMSTLGKYTVLNYFMKWADKWHGKIFSNLRYTITLNENQSIKDSLFNFSNEECYYHLLTSENDKSRCIGLLNVENEFVKSLTNDLFCCVSLTCGNVGHYSNLKNGSGMVRENGYIPLSGGNANTYLTTFFDVVRETLCKPNEEKEQTKIAEEPKNVTDDMRSELYRYLKQVYDKWLPQSTLDEWKFENFFNDNSDSNGRTFKFIDSYYNKIGQKLVVNPQKITDMIGNSLSNSEVNYMLFNFLADAYAQSKCMFICVQNFVDLSREKSMENMFKPIAYNDIKRPKKHPDFVVIYPYDKSQHLDMSNSNYKDDSFMLNNEMETPLAIRSRGDGESDKWYKIPAFGVSYGRQYQSIFKNVNVSMANAVMTEQAILAKHAILRGATNTNTKGVAAQDLYSIYANQSYTCKVEMLGCMWVQPMMYMVLLNVPMFRGSYMIMSVKHSMTPGNMQTELTAVRMADASNKIIEDIFTDEVADEDSPMVTRSSSSDYEKTRSECEYHVYPLFKSDSALDLSEELNRMVSRDDCFSQEEYRILSGWTIHEALSRIAANEGGNSVRRQYMLVATVLYNRRLKYGGYKQAIFHHPQFDIKKLKSSLTPPNDDVRESVRNIFTNSPTWIMSQYDLDSGVRRYYANTIVKKLNKKSYSNSPYFKKEDTITASTINEVTLSQILYFGNYQEYISGTNKWVLEQPVIMGQDASNDGVYGHCFNGEYEGSGSLECKRFWHPSEKKNDSYGDKNNAKQDDRDERMIKELYIPFFEAVQKSINSNSKLAIELEYKLDTDKIMHITQKDKKIDHLAYVYDIILNSYYQYVGELYWVYVNSQEEEDPKEVCVKVINSQADVNRKIRLTKYEDGKVSQASVTFGGNDKFSTMFSYAVKKRYGDKMNSRYVRKEMDQINDFSGIINADVSKCDAVSAIPNGGFFVDDSLVGSNSTMIGKFNVSKAVLWITNNSYNQYIKDKCGKCATYVLMALAAGGLTLPNGERHSCGEKSGSGYATNLWYDGLLESWGFSKIMSKSGKTDANNRTFPQPSSLQKGDVAIIGFNKNDSQFKSESYRYHACMWTGKEWISDFKQGDRMSPYKDFSMNIEKYYPYMVFRYTKRD